MTFSVYGVSRSGKDYLIQRLKEYFESRGLFLEHINGSKTLNDMSETRYSKKFKQLTDEEKNMLRIEFIEYIHEKEKTNPYIVVDGHYAFYDKSNRLFTVFTEQDLKCYTKFFYLDTDPIDIVNRMRASEGEKKNTAITAEDIRRWQNYEIEHMTEDLIAEDKELHIVRFESDFCLEYIFEAVTTDKYDSKSIAAKMLADVEIPCSTVVLTDCDKTLSVEDSTNIALDYVGASKSSLKEIFSGDRYSNFQMQLAGMYYDSVGAFTCDSIKAIADRITINDLIIDDLRNKTNATVLAITAGNSCAWQAILKKCGLNAIVLENNGLTSKYVKYYVAKLLREQGKFVVAIGDSLLDSMMVTGANIGYLATKGYRANVEAFMRANPSVRQLSYYEYKYDNVITEDSVLSIKTLPLTKEAQGLIDVCKSEFGITGKRLREAHRKLGALVASTIASDYANEKFVVVIIMRSGLCFGEGIANELDAPMLFHYDKNKAYLEEQLADNPQLEGYRMILCDGVVNTGKRILELASAYLRFKPIIATNVISEKYDASNMIPVYASRISKNNYIGSKQKYISNGEGPDTSDRLFNLI